MLCKPEAMVTIVHAQATHKLGDAYRCHIILPIPKLVCGACLHDCHHGFRCLQAEVWREASKDHVQ